MQENKYEPSLAEAWRIAKSRLPDKPSKKDLTNFALATIDTMYDFSGSGQLSTIDSYFRERGVFGIEQQRQALTDGKANATMIALSDVMGVYESVCLHIRDRELVEAILRSDIDAVAGDAVLPFPVVELAFPSGIPIIGNYEVAGVLVVDYLSSNFKQWFEGMANVRSRSIENGRVMARYMVVLRMRRLDGTHDPSSYIKKFDEHFDLSLGVNPPDITASEIACLDAHARLAWGVFLYLQSVDSKRAMVEETGRHQLDGIPASIARICKKQRHFSIIDVAAPIHAKGIPLGGTHASPVTHWRRGHIRTLRNERYERNPNGSLKTRWIRPVKVMAGTEGVQMSERKIG